MSVQKAKGIFIGVTELDELQEIARIATREALKAYDMTDIPAEALSLNITFEGDDRLFELCFQTDNADDITVISRARVNRITRDVSVVVINLEKK